MKTRVGNTDRAGNVARVRAILRRSKPELIASVLRAGDLELDPAILAPKKR